MCFASSQGCKDYGSEKSFIFETKQKCTTFAYELLEVGRRAAEEQGLIYLDGKAFCLKAVESRET